MPIRLRDVAKAAGVSKMTVSNVLNGHRDRVSEATTARVMDVVQRLGYVPNASARALSVASSGIIAVVYQRLPAEVLPLTNPHDSLLLGEIERQVSEAGHYLMVRSGYRPIDSASSLRSWNVDGAIFLNTAVEDIETMKSRHDIPLVFVDNYSDSPLISTVGVDDFHGGYLAGKHLIAAGHRDMCFIAPAQTRNQVMEQRLSGFRSALAAEADTPPPRLIDCPLDYQSALALGEGLSADLGPVTAIFAPADLIAVALVKGLIRGGVDVPHRVSVVGFDDLPISAQVTPELSTIHQDVTEKARISVELLLRLLAAGPDAPNERISLPVQLVERQTVAVLQRD